MIKRKILVVEDERLIARDIALNRARAQLAKPVGYLAKPFEDYELREVMEAAFKDG